jgi:hypothetical protein
LPSACPCSTALAGNSESAGRKRSKGAPFAICARNVPEAPNFAFTSTPGFLAWKSRAISSRAGFRLAAAAIEIACSSLARASPGARSAASIERANRGRGK